MKKNLPDATTPGTRRLIVIAVMILLCTGSFALPIKAQTTANPHLLFSHGEVEILKTRAATTHRDIWVPIRDYIDMQLGSAPPAMAPPDGDVSAYRSFANRLIPMAIVCLVEADPQYCDLARNYLLTLISWDQWGENNLRSLGHAHMVFAVAIAYDWLYEFLTPAERAAVASALGEKAQELYEASASAHYVPAWGNWWRDSYAQNHYAIAHSSLGMAGLVLLGEDSRAQSWIDQAQGKLERLQFLLNGITDASWHEGMAYQNYMLTMMLPFAISLHRNQGIDILPANYMRNYTSWRLYNFLPNSLENAFTHGNFDLAWVNDYEPQNILRFVAREYRNPYAEWTAQQIVANRGRVATLSSVPWYVFEFLYYDDSIAPQPPDNLPLARTFVDMQGVIWRTGWGHDDLVFGLYSGAFGGDFMSQTFIEGVFPWNQPCHRTGCSLNVGHNHDDANNFSLYRAGNWLIRETIGVGNSNTDLHNTVLIDDESQYSPPAENFGEYVEDFINRSGFLATSASTRNFDYVAANATQRYAVPDLTEFTRHVLFVRPGYFVMLDNLTAGLPHQYEWVAHFGTGVVIDGDWVRGEGYGEQVVGVGVVAPQPFAYSSGDDGSPYIRIRPLADTANARLINILYPTDAASWESRPNFSLLQDNDTAAALRIEPDAGTFDDVLFVYGSSLDEAVTVGDYRLDGQAAVVSRDAGGNLRRLFTHGGTFLTVADEDELALVTNLVASEPFEVTYSANTAEVWGNILSQVTLYAPNTQHLTVNEVLADFVRDGEYIIFPVNP
jgi:hypothetical protein